VLESLARLGISVLERGWLSSNNVLFAPPGDGPVSVVDTGYVSHAAQTVELVRAAARGRRVDRVVNTHLHSDHCGGNAALQSAFGCEVWVPAPSFNAARTWDADRLSFLRTDQRCERFVPVRGIESGSEIELAGRLWRVLSAPGHDPDAVVFFQGDERVLISGDALWENRLAVIFPELEGGEGFGPTRWALDLIESLCPRVVIPGHGRPFTDVAGALRASRGRLVQYEAQPERHFAHSVRVLVMFHLLEFRRRRVYDVVEWLLQAPIFMRGLAALGAPGSPAARDFAREVIGRLVASGAVRVDGPDVVVAADRV